MPLTSWSIPAVAAAACNWASEVEGAFIKGVLSLAFILVDK
jgi:hypothetical protein